MTKILFVYNADAGLWNAILDGLHKTFRPKTYPCSLCAMTYGTVKMRSKWKTFLKEELQAIPYDFLHKDEFEEKYGAKALQEHSLPAVFWANETKLSLQPIIPAEEMDQLELEALMQVLRERVLGEEN